MVFLLPRLWSENGVGPRKKSNPIHINSQLTQLVLHPMDKPFFFFFFFLRNTG